LAREKANAALDDFVVDPKSVDDGLAIVKYHKITLNELRQHSNTIKTEISKFLKLFYDGSDSLKEINKIINDFSHEIYWISPVLDKFIIKTLLGSSAFVKKKEKPTEP